MHQRAASCHKLIDMQSKSNPAMNHLTDKYVYLFAGRGFAHHANLSMCSAPQRVEPAQGREFNADKQSVEDLHVFPYLE
jgi:hypothetical protein